MRILKLFAKGLLFVITCPLTHWTALGLIPCCQNFFFSYFQVLFVYLFLGFLVWGHFWAKYAESKGFDLSNNNDDPFSTITQQPHLWNDPGHSE